MLKNVTRSVHLSYRSTGGPDRIRTCDLVISVPARRCPGERHAEHGARVSVWRRCLCRVGLPPQAWGGRDSNPHCHVGV